MMQKRTKYKIDPKEIRVYHKENSCIFKKNNEEFGALSNMSVKFPLKINGIDIRTTEAIYQASRFPHIPEVQQKIIEAKSPMLVKMISNSNKKHSRQDWDNIRLKIMKWCLQVKLAQNFLTFGSVLNETGLKDIVENSSKDNFWGAIPNEDETVFTGKNALGRLLMDLRQAFLEKDNYSLLLVESPQIENFFLMNEPIRNIDERQKFINNSRASVFVSSTSKNTDRENISHSLKQIRKAKIKKEVSSTISDLFSELGKTDEQANADKK